MLECEANWSRGKSEPIFMILLQHCNCLTSSMYAGSLISLLEMIRRSQIWNRIWKVQYFLIF